MKKSLILANLKGFPRKHCNKIDCFSSASSIIIPISTTLSLFVIFVNYHFMLARKVLISFCIIQYGFGRNCVL